MAAPTNAALVKKALANSEPSTHGPSRQMPMLGLCVRFQCVAEADRGVALTERDQIDPKRTCDAAIIFILFRVPCQKLVGLPQRSTCRRPNGQASHIRKLLSADKARHSTCTS